MPRSGATPVHRRSTVVPMRRALVGVLGLALGLGIASAGVVLAPALDGRWQTATAPRDPSIADRLARDARTPLLFVPESVTRDPAAPVTLVVVLPGLGGI